MEEQNNKKFVVPSENVAEDTTAKGFPTETLRLVGGEMYMDCVHEEFEQIANRQSKFSPKEQWAISEQAVTQRIGYAETVTLELVQQNKLIENETAKEDTDSHSNVEEQEDIVELTEYYSISESGSDVDEAHIRHTQSVIYNNPDIDSKVKKDTNGNFSDASSTILASRKSFSSMVSNCKRQSVAHVLWKAKPKCSLATNKRLDYSSNISDASSTTTIFSNTTLLSSESALRANGTFKQTKPNRVSKTNFSAADIFACAAKRAAEIAAAAVTIKNCISDTNLILTQRLKVFSKDYPLSRPGSGYIIDDALQGKLNAAFMQQACTGLTKPEMCYERLRQINAMRCSYLTIRQLTFQCLFPECQASLNPARLLQHYLTHHLKVESCELREINVDVEIALTFDPRNLNCSQHNCLEFRIFKGKENKYLAMVENDELPESYKNMEYHLPLIVLISKTSWNALASVNDKIAGRKSMCCDSHSAPSTANRKAFKNVALKVRQSVVAGLYVIWVFCPQTLKPLNLTVTVSDAQRTEQRSTVIETRNTIEENDFCDILQKNKSFLRLTHGEIKLLSRNFTEKLNLEVTLHNPVIQSESPN